MKTHFRLLTGLFLLALLTTVAWTRFAPAATSAAGYTGLARIDGPVELEMAITPPVGSPRDALTLELTLINRTSAEAAPTVLINLPPELHATVSRLPAGASFNVQANALTWQPRIAAQTQLQLTLPLRAETADLTDPEVVVTTSLAHDGRNQQAAATLWIGTLPTITSLPSSPRVSIGQPVQLSAEVDGPGPISQTWHLGDGRRVEVNNPQVVYPQAGVYDVVVEATNPLGTVERRMQLTIVPHAAAQFSPDDDTPGIGQPITFRNQSGGQPGMTYSWTFGDGTISAEANPIHTFDTPGTYEVRLVASNAFGTSETVETITVGSPPSADLFVADSAPAGDFVEAVVAADETATEFEWEMGDGRVYEGAEIAHAYRQTGDYYVTMTAKNEFGETRVGKWVHIEPGTLRVFMPIVGNMMGVTEGSSVDIGNGPIELQLDPVDLDGEFRMATLDLPEDLTPTEALFHYINAAREQFGLNPLQNVGSLNNVAQNHANDMAGYDFTSHTGSDGSTPQERFLFYGYRQGYAGEATAWGFDDPKGAVEFWVNSESHRPIILNKYATDVGVGFGQEYGSSSIWYWTAEFGNKFASSIQPMLRVEGPAVGATALNSDVVTFTWNYSGPLAAGQRFTVYLTDESGALALGSVTAPVHGTRYALSVSPVEIGPDSAVGRFDWHVQLEDMVGNAQLVGPSRAIAINRDPSLPTPTPMLTPTVPATVTSTPLPTPTPTSTPRSEPPTPTPRPTSPPAVIVTSTPAP